MGHLGHYFSSYKKTGLRTNADNFKYVYIHGTRVPQICPKCPLIGISTGWPPIFGGHFPFFGPIDVSFCPQKRTDAEASERPHNRPAS